jgi:CO/xanthine dehydrogenase Mo-binding subunit
VPARLRAPYWSAPPRCHAQAGQVIHAASNRSIGYGQLAETAAKQPAPQNVKLKDPKDFKLIGSPAKRLDSPEKVDGTAMFGLDVRVPDMDYAAIANCPAFGGTLASVDDTNAKKIPGVRQVVKIDNAVAVDRRPYVGGQTRRAGARYQVERRRGRQFVDEADRRRSCQCVATQPRGDA